APRRKGVVDRIRPMGALGTDVDARTEPATASSEPDAAPAEPSWARRNWPLLALAAATVIVTLLAKHLIYPAFSWNRDESTYLWQIGSLRTGHVFTTDGNAPQFFW